MQNPLLFSTHSKWQDKTFHFAILFEMEKFHWIYVFISVEKKNVAEQIIPSDSENIAKKEEKKHRNS